MINRIELILKTQNLTPTQFADAIGIQRSSMSHILARRNNPSLDFVMKVLNRFPEINAEWLLTGKNQMLNIGNANSSPQSAQTQQANFQTPEFEWNNEPAPPTRVEPSKISHPAPAPTEAYEKIRPASKPDTNPNSDIERIIVFFMDGTFKSYV